MNIDDMVKELEKAYWLTVHNKASDHVRRLTFANYQMIMSNYFANGEEPNNNYMKIHQHFYSHECYGKSTRFEDENK